MKLKEREVREHLAPRTTPEPPPDLLQKIKAEIPDDLPLPASEESERPESPSDRRWDGRWLLAAGLAAALLGGVWVTRQLQAPGSGDLQLAQAPREAAEPVLSPKDAADEAPRLPEREEPAAGEADPAPEPRAKKLEVPKPQSRARVEEGNEALSRRMASQENLRGTSPRVEPMAEEERSRIAPAPEARAQLRALGYVGGGAPESDMAYAVPPASTGGTAEPNDAPYGDVFFDGYGVNPFIDTEDDALSTFGLDVDTGSYTVVRRYLRDGHLPPADAVRIEEMINYFDYGDAGPEEREFALHAEGAPSIFGEGERYYLLRLALQGREISAAERKSARLTFVVDVSGSMARENRLGLVRQALELLTGELRPDDRVGLVVYGSEGRVVLEPTADHDRIREALASLQPEGSTNAEEGLRLGYDLASSELERGTINRVILCSDGVANVGKTGPESILGEIRRQAEKGIELTTVGFGMGNYNDVLMEQLADRGNGRYAYVDTLEEARRIFAENLTGTLQTLAAEARAQVEFNPELVARYRLLGYENRDIADERFRDDTVDAGEIGMGHSVTALYEVKLHRRPKRNDRLGTLRLRYASMEKGEMVELEKEIRGFDLAKSWEKASPAFRLASLVAEFGELLKGTYWAKKGNMKDVFRRAQQVATEYPGSVEVSEFATLAGRAAELQGNSD